MFYCSRCAARNQWPESMSKSLGICEVCRKPNKVCNDVQSRYLPIPPRRRAGKEESNDEP